MIIEATSLCLRVHDFDYVRLLPYKKLSSKRLKHRMSIVNHLGGANNQNHSLLEPIYVDTMI